MSDLYTISVLADFDTTIYVATDCSNIGGTCLAAADDAVSGEQLSMWLDASKSYYIFVDGYGNLSAPAGPYTFTVKPQCVPQCEGKTCGDDGCGDVCGECDKGTECSEEGICVGIPGDTCGAPFVIASAPASVDGDTSDASDIYAVPYDACPGETGIRGKLSNDEVWSFTPTASGVYTIDVTAWFSVSVYVLKDCTHFVETCFIEQDPGEFVWWEVTDECEYPGDACPGIASGYTIDMSTAKLPLWLEADETVFIVIDGNSFNQNLKGPYTLDISEPCTPQCDGKSCGPDGCGLTCGECDLGLLCSDVGACETLEGNTCETAFPIPSLPFTVEGNTQDATNVYGLPKTGCPEQEEKAGAGSKDEVYVLTPEETALYDIKLESAFNSVVYVLKDCAIHLSTCFYKETLGYYSWVASTGGCQFGSSDACMGMMFTIDDDEPLKVEMEAGVSYYIVVDGSGGLSDYSGAYTLSVEKACVPQCENKECGDDGCGEVCDTCPDGFECNAAFKCEDASNQDGNTCDTAWQVVTTPFLGAGDTTDDADIYQPNECGKDVVGSKDEVWAFTPLKTGPYVITVKPDPPFETVFSVVKSCTGLTYECVIGTSAETISPSLQAGVTYHIIVDSNEDGSQEGTYVITIKEPE